MKLPRNQPSLRRSVLLVALVLCMAGAGQAVNLSNSNTDSWSPRIAIDSNDNVHVVWWESYSDTSGDIYYAKYSNIDNKWNSPINISGTRNAHAYTNRPCGIAVDGSNKVYVVWTEGDAVRLKTSSGGKWGSTLTVSDDQGTADCPRITATPIGNIYIAWWTSNGRIHVRARVGGSWERENEISSGWYSKFPDISVGRNKVYASWVEKYSGKYRAVCAYRSTTYNASWSSILGIYDSKMSHQHCVVEVDHSDVPHFAWTEYHSGNRQVQYVYRPGNSFSYPRALSSITLLHYPAIYQRSGNVYVCWQVGGYGGGSAVYYNAKINGNWGSETAIPDSSGCTYCDIVTDSGGRLNLVFERWGEIYHYASVSPPEPPPPGPDPTPPPVNKPPVANFNFSPKSNLWAPVLVEFDGSASYDPDGRIIRYDWIFGDGTTGSGRHLFHRFENQGTYDVKLTVIDNKGAQASRVKTLKVLDIFPPLNIRWKTHVYAGLFLQRYITEVSWKRNPANKKYNIVKYKVYRRDKDKYYKPYNLIHETTSDVFQYTDLDVKAKGKYVYSVTAVDAFGHESRVEGLPYENFSAIVERVDSAYRTSDRRIIK